MKTVLSIFEDDKEFFKLLDNFGYEITKTNHTNDDLACFYNSSGTTGNSQYIKYNHKNLMSMIESVV